MIRDSAVHPLTAVGTALTTVAAGLQHFALMLAGLALGWLGFYLDLRVRQVIRRHVDRAEKPPTHGKP